MDFNDLPSKYKISPVHPDLHGLHKFLLLPSDHLALGEVLLQLPELNFHHLAVLEFLLVLTGQTLVVLQLSL